MIRAVSAFTEDRDTWKWGAASARFFQPNFDPDACRTELLVCIAGTSVKVVRNDGSLAKSGEAGELYVRGGQIALGELCSMRDTLSLTHFNASNQAIMGMKRRKTLNATIPLADDRSLNELPQNKRDIHRWVCVSLLSVTLLD